jgi:MFS family permease
VPISAGLGLLTAATLWFLPAVGSGSYVLLIGVCVIAGLGALGWVGMVTVLRAELSPPQAIGIVTSLGSFTGYAGSLLGPPLFGRLLDNTGNYQLAWRLLAGCALIAAILILQVRERHVQRPAS